MTLLPCSLLPINKQKKRRRFNHLVRFKLVSVLFRLTPFPVRRLGKCFPLFSVNIPIFRQVFATGVLAYAPFVYVQRSNFWIFVCVQRIDVSLSFQTRLCENKLDNSWRFPLFTQLIFECYTNALAGGKLLKFIISFKEVPWTKNFTENVL